MVQILVYITDLFFKNLSGKKNSNLIGKGFSLVAVNLCIHFMVLIKLVLHIENLESTGVKSETILFAFLFFGIFLSFLFSLLFDRIFINKCIFKYKKNTLINNTGSVVFALYFFINMYLSVYILFLKITFYSYVLFLILPLSFYIYCKIIDWDMEKNKDVIDK